MLVFKFEIDLIEVSCICEGLFLKFYVLITWNLFVCLGIPPAHIIFYDFSYFYRLRNDILRSGTNNSHRHIKQTRRLYLSAWEALDDNLLLPTTNILDGFLDDFPGVNVTASKLPLKNNIFLTIQSKFYRRSNSRQLNR